MLHELKTWKPFFKSVWGGIKPFEVRKDDRDYKAGDSLMLQEYDAEGKVYTGRAILTRVTYKLWGGNFGVENGYCVLGIEIKERISPTP